LTDRQKLHHAWLLDQRVDEPCRDDQDLVDVAFQKEVAGKGGNRTGLGESRRVGEGELRGQPPAGARDELRRPLAGGDEQGRGGVELPSEAKQGGVAAPAHTVIRARPGHGPSADSPRYAPPK